MDAVGEVRRAMASSWGRDVRGAAPSALSSRPSAVSRFPFTTDISLVPAELKGKPSQGTAISSFSLFDDGQLGKILYK